MNNSNGITLLIDRDAARRRQLMNDLSAAGLAVRAWAEGEDWRALAREHRPELILLDEPLPTLEGFTECCRLQVTPDGPAVPVLSLADVMAESERSGEGLAGRLRAVLAGQSEAALRAREECFRTMFERHKAVMLLIEPESGAIIDANAAAVDFYGYSRAELCARRIQEINQLPPEEVDVERQLAVREQRNYFIFPHRLASDQVRWVEVYSSPIEAQGRTLLFSIIHDITERTEAEEALRQSEQLYRAIGESIDYGVWVCEPEGRNTYASESFLKLVGLTQQQCSNFGWGEVLHPDDAERTITAWKECVRTGGAWDIEHRFRGVDGQWHDVLARGVPVRNEQGEILCWAGINLDISRLKRAEESLRQNREDLNRAQAVAHIGSWRLDVRRDALLWSDETYRIFGLPLETPLTYATFLGAVHPADREYVDQQWTAALRGEPYDIEHRIITAAGTVKWVREQAELEFDETGALLGGFGTAQDITGRKEMGEALRRGEAQLRLITDTVPALIAYLDTGLHYRLVNRTYERWFGFSSAQLVGRHVRDAQGEVTWRIVQPYLERTLAGETVTYDQEVPYFDTEPRWVHVTYTPDRDDDGRVRGIVVLAIDSGKAKRTAERIRRQNATLEGITRIFHEALACANDESLGRTCLAVAEQLTQSRFGFIGEINPATGRLDSLALSDPGWEACRMADQSGHGKKVPVGFTIHGIYGRVLRDGRSFFTNDPPAHPDSIGTPAGHPPLAAFLGVPLTHGGETIGMIGLGNREGGYRAEDLETAEALAPAIVEALLRKRAEDALRLRNERLTLLSEAAGHLLKAENPDTMVLELFEKVSRHLDLHAYFNFMVNDAGDALRLDSCAGISEEVARTIERLDFGAAVCGTVAMLRQAIHATEIQTSDDENVQLIKGFGIRAYACNPLLAGERLLGTLSFASRAKDRFDEDELEFMRTICQYVAMAKERLRLEKESRAHIARLAEADRRKDEFLAMLAHELRNPLAPIRYALQVLDAASPGSPRMKKQREVIERQVGHMARLLDDLLDVSRITRGKIKLRNERLDLRVVAGQAVEAMRATTDARGQRLEYWDPLDPLWVSGDATRLEQVLRNLLHNASKYTEPGGRIRLDLGREWLEGLTGAPAAVAWVTDSGVGIGAEMLPRVFDLFAQDEQSLDRSQGGLGIGLTMVKRLVEMHGGRVEAASAGQDQGSEFTIRLPLANAAAGADSAEDVPEMPPPLPHADRPEAALKVLVVDDNEDSRYSLGELLEIWGHDVLLAGDGPHGLEQAIQARPEVVLLDIGLPGMDGYEVAQRLRAEPATRTALLVALTGYGQEEDRQRSAAAGFDRHFTKPINLRDLEAVLEQAARRQDCGGFEI